MNLTAVTERGAMMDRHIADSLSLLPTIEGAYATHSEGESVKVVDIGSGAGLPGIVLAIARPGDLLIPWYW
jgi:16S rRNA (guanine527-N7)-methyltransferase